LLASTTIDLDITMRNLAVISATLVGLLSHAVFALPTPQRAMYPYPIYRSDNAVAFASVIPPNIDSRHGPLEMISAVFSQAVDVSFVTVVLRPHEHLVSFLRYYNPKKPVPLPQTISLGHSKRALHPVNPGATNKGTMLPREGLGEPGAFRSHDYRRSKDNAGGERESFPTHDYKRSESARSSTHSTSGEHLKLLTPEYLFGLLSIAAPSNGVPSWRIYALILIAIIASVTSLISAFIVPQAPSLASSVPTFVSICLPLPFLLSLAHIVKSARVETQAGPFATTTYTKRSSRCTELGLTGSEDAAPLPVTLRFPRIWEFAFTLQCIGALASLCEIVEAVIGGRVPALELLAAMANVLWGGGIMAIHFLIIYEPTYQLPVDPAPTCGTQHTLERVADQPSEDFMTLRDPFASPTQVGFPLPPSPTAPRRTPKRRASEPLKLTRFGSFAGLHTPADEKQSAPEIDPDTQFLEALVRHALFSTGRVETNSTPVAEPTVPVTPTKPVVLSSVKPFDERAGSPGCLSRASTPTIRQKRSKELGAPKAPIPAPAFPWHPFRPSTPPRPSTPSRPSRVACRTPPPKLVFPEPPSSFPFSSPSSAESDYSVLVTRSSTPTAYTAPPSPIGSDSGSSFVSPPPTPTPGPSGSKSNHKVRSLVPARPAPILAPAPLRRRGSGPV
ncbi:hypothetical protein FRC07_010646, partial [Ceratobasidium sp. 392]